MGLQAFIMAHAVATRLASVSSSLNHLGLQRSSLRLADAARGAEPGAARGGSDTCAPQSWQRASRAFPTAFWSVREDRRRNGAVCTVHQTEEVYAKILAHLCARSYTLVLYSLDAKSAGVELEGSTCIRWPAVTICLLLGRVLHEAANPRYNQCRDEPADPPTARRQLA
jgi:hypothetical protein